MVLNPGSGGIPVRFEVRGMGYSIEEIVYEC